MKKIFNSILKKSIWNVFKPDDFNAVVTQMNTNDLNTIGSEFCDDFNETMDFVEKEYPNIPLIITSEKSGVFSGGIDRQWFENLPNEGEKILLNINSVFERLFLMERPTVAAVNGHSISGGFILSLCCDFRFVDNQYSMSLKAPQIGIPFPSSVYYIIGYEMPNFKKMMLLGDQISGDYAIKNKIALQQKKGTLADSLDLCDSISSVETFVANKNSLKSGYKSFKENEGKGIDAVFIETTKKKSFEVSLAEFLKNLTISVLDIDEQPTTYNY